MLSKDWSIDFALESCECAGEDQIFLAGVIRLHNSTFEVVINLLSKYQQKAEKARPGHTQERNL